MVQNMSKTKAVFAVISLFSVPGLTQADGVDEPIPSFYQEPGHGLNRVDDAQQHPNERVDPFTGKLQWHFVDLDIPGNGGLDIKVQRSYSSLNEILGEPSPAGIGWTMHFGRVIRKATVNVCAMGESALLNPVLELPDGSRQMLYDSVDGTVKYSPGEFRATCNQAGGLIVQSPDGTSYEMTTPGPVIGLDPNKYQATWYTTRIVDRNNNTLNFTYTPMTSGAFGVQSITSSDGRQVTFSYSGDVISSVSSGNSTWTYSLTPISGVTPTQYTLDTVTRPDGSTWHYQYNPPGSGPGVAPAGGYSMNHVTYPTGGTIDYTYGFVTFSANPSIPVSTVVTQKTTFEGAWTYAYQPATSPLSSSGGIVSYTIDPSGSSTLDRTTVTGPEGTTSYFHIGYMSVVSGTVYLVGTLAGKSMSSSASGQSFITQIESYAWAPMMISNAANIRPGTAMTFDPATYIPYMTDKQISRNGRIYDTAMSNFDGYANPQTIIETGTDSRTTTLTYYTDPTKWIIHQKKDETISTIGTINRTFDGNGNLTLEDKYGVSTNYTPTAEGDVGTKTDAAGNSTTYSAYFRGIPQSESQPEGVTISRTVSSDGNILSQTDGEGATTGYTYDGLNRLTSITHPTGNSVSVVWDPNHRTVSRGGYQEVSTFDGFGRQVQDVHSDNVAGQTVTQTFAYDTLGRRTFASYPNDSIGTGFVYDMIGELLAVYNGYSPGGTSASSARSYLYQDSTVQMTNERGYTYTYTYRAYGDPDERDLLSIAAPEPSASVSIGRNGLGQMTDVTQNGVTRSYGYDSRFYLTTMTEPEVGITTFGRDAVGNMTSKQVGASATTGFGYDGRNRVTSITYPSGTPSVVRTYYKDDKPKSSDNGVASHAYIYDQNKNLTQETLTMAGQTPFVIAYSYDGNDALDVLTYGSGKTVRYSPDGFGWPTAALPYVSSVTHHPNGQVASISYANGVQTTIGLNARQWPNSLSVVGSSPIFNTAYSYDEAGNVLGIQDSLDPTFNRGLDYDAIDRLTTANGSWGSGTITYNGNGDILSQQLGTTSSLTYTYDSQHRLGSVTGTTNHSYTYDAYGNVTGNSAYTFTYNDASNMKCSNCGVFGEVDYDYDAGNMRVRATTSGTSTYYVYGANGNLLWEQTPGTSLTEYVYLQGKQVAIRAHTGS
jgi:YD repeat-containing protein